MTELVFIFKDKYGYEVRDSTFVIGYIFKNKNNDWEFDGWAYTSNKNSKEITKKIKELNGRCTISRSNKPYGCNLHDPIGAYLK